MAATFPTDKRYAGAYPCRGTFPAAANELILRGTTVCVNATGYAVEGVLNEGFNAAGIASATFDNRTTAPEGGAAGAIDVEVEYGVFGRKINGTTPVPGNTVFVYDNDTITLDSNSGARGVAGSVVEVRDSIAYVYFGPHVVGLLDLSAVYGADILQLQTDVDAAEVTIAAQGVSAVSAKNQIPLRATEGLDIATGAKLAVFADGASTTPGTQFTDSKTAAVRWNNHATPGAVALNIPYPAELNDAANVVFHALVSKVGATVGDATKLTVGAYEIVPGALHDADADFGGDTTAVVGDAASKTVTEVTLTLALAEVHAYPAALCLTIKPKAGTLGTDDLLMHSAWLEYTSKLMTS